MPSITGWAVSITVVIKNMKAYIIISRLEIHIRLINHAKIGPSPGSDTLYAVQPYCPGTKGNCPSECDSNWWIAQTVSTIDTTMKVECLGNFNTD